MTFWQIAANNIRRGWPRYVAYFLSCTFAVAVFFVYAAFIWHPEVVSGHINAGVRQGMVMVEFIIIVFIFFFVLYSNGAFLRSRRKEFGLLNLLGMTRRQLSLLLFWEDTAIILLALGSGIGIGLLFTKLFLMAIGVLLAVENPLHFHIAPAALLWTVLSFLVVLEAITLVSLLRLRRDSVRELLVAHRQPKAKPTYSVWLVFFGLITLSAGYGLAFVTATRTIVTNMLPILVLVLTGSYFLFTQAGIAAVSWLQRRPRWYYRGTNLLTGSRLSFRLQDTARLLFSVATLAAVVVTALGTFNTLLQNDRSNAMRLHPQAYGIKAAPGSTAPAVVEEVLARHQLPITRRTVLPGLPGSLPPARQFPVLVVSAQHYNRLAAQSGASELQVAPGEAIFVYPRAYGDNAFDLPPHLELDLAGQNISLTLREKVPANLINPNLAHFMLVLDSQQYTSLDTAYPADRKTVIYGYEFTGWEKSRSIVAEISARLPKGTAASDRVSNFLEMRQIGAITMFIGIFVSFLFFIAAGSLIYFKLFTEAGEDRQQYAVLRDIGITRAEIMSVVNRELGLLFFAPLAVGFIHAAFALRTLKNIMHFDVAVAGLMIMAGYLVLQYCYFLFVRGAYVRQVLDT